MLLFLLLTLCRSIILNQDDTGTLEYAPKRSYRTFDINDIHIAQNGNDLTCTDCEDKSETITYQMECQFNIVDTAYKTYAQNITYHCNNPYLILKIDGTISGGPSGCIDPIDTYSVSIREISTDKYGIITTSRNTDYYSYRRGKDIPTSVYTSAGVSTTGSTGYFYKCEPRDPLFDMSFGAITNDKKWFVAFDQVSEVFIAKNIRTI
jgi:hypothetical protein